MKLFVVHSCMSTLAIYYDRNWENKSTLRGIRTQRRVRLFLIVPGDRQALAH